MNRYEQAHQFYFKCASDALQQRITAVKSDSNSRDFEVEQFVKAVIALAESDAPIN